MKKRILAATLAGLMVVSMAAGCAKPKVTLGQYKGLELTDVSQAEVETQMESTLAQYEALVEVDRAAEEGDVVNINYVGMLDGIAFEGGTYDDEAGYDLELGSGSFIDGFEEGLVGVVAGQEIDLDLTFPDPYENNPDLAGQAVVFHVTVNKVQTYQIPELTDEFVVENYPDVASTVEEFWDALYKEMQMSTFYEQITELIMASSTVENLPEDEVAEEALAFVNEYTYYAEMYASLYGLDAESILYYFWGIESTEALQEYALEYAELSVTNRLIIEEIAKVEGLKVTDEIYKEKVAEFTKTSGYSSEDTFVEAYGEDYIKEVILSDMVMEFIIAEATIVEPTEE